MGGIVKRIGFWLNAPRIGPDMPLTHWMLQFTGLGQWLAVRKLARFGAGSALRPFCSLVRTDRIEIGERVVIRPQTIIMANDYARVIIGNDVLIGSGAHFYSANHRFDQIDLLIADQGHSPAADLIVEDDVWTGACAVILAGVRLGRHSVIAAVSVVTRSTDPYGVYAGVPARKIRDLKAQG